MMLLGLLLLASPLLGSPPPEWRVLPAPEDPSIERVAWSADGVRLALCGDDHVSVIQAPLKQIVIASHGCADVAFDGPDVVYAVYRDEAYHGVWRSGPTHATPRRLTSAAAYAVLIRDGRLWVAGKDVTIRAQGKVVARAPHGGIRRLIPTPAGVLAVTAHTILLLDDALQIKRTLTPVPVPAVNGLYDAVALPDGRVAAVENGGSVWIWDAAGAVIAHGQSIGNARWILWTGTALVVGDTWMQIDPLRLIARAVRQPRSVGPAALSPDGKRIAIPLNQGVLLRSATQTVDLPRGLPATARGIVVTDDAVWVADDHGQLVHFDRKGKVQAVHPIATSKLRDLVGDPAKTLYAGTEWGHVIAWRAKGPHRRWKNRGVDQLTLTPDGTTLYAGGQKTADRFDTRTGARTSMIEAADDYQAFHPTLTPKGEVIWFRGGHPAVWHPTGKAPVSIQPGRSGAFDVRGRLWINDRDARPGLYGWPNISKIKQLPWMGDGRFVPLADGGMASTGWGGQVQAFNADGSLRWDKRAPWHVGGVAVLTEPKRGDRLLTGGPDLTLSTWDLNTGARSQWAPPGRGQRVSGMAFSADGRLLAVGADSTGVRVWDTKTHRMVRDLAVPDGDLHVNRHGTEWLIHRHDSVRRWPVAGGAVKTIAWDERFESWRGTPAGGAFVLHDLGGQGHVVDLRTGKTVWTVEVPESVRFARVSADGQRVAMLVPGALMELRVQTRGKPQQEAIKGPFNDLGWHGETLLVWKDEEGAFEWTAKGLRPRPDLPRFSGMMTSTGSRLALHDGRMVRVQEGATIVGALPVERHGGAHLRLSPDGKVLAIGGNFTGSVVLWSVKTGKAIARYEAFADGLWRSTTVNGAVSTGKTIRARR